MSAEFNNTQWDNEQITFKGVSGRMPDVIVPSTPNMLKHAQSAIAQRTTNFQQRYFKDHPEKLEDQRITGLFDDMNHAGFWHVLARIDGADFNPFESRSTNLDRLKSGEERRGWAVSNFTQEELQEILQIVTNTALMGVYSDYSQPGFKRGHSILYSHLVAKPESMFAGIVTPALKKRLNNGRFWENLPELRAHQYPYADEVADVLTNFEEDLDSDFFEQGYEIFKRNGGEDNILKPDLAGLSRGEIAMYWAFVQKLDQEVYADKNKRAHRYALRLANESAPLHTQDDYYRKPADTDERIAFLVRPFLHYIHAYAHAEDRRFKGETVETMFADSTLQKYLEQSDMLREELASNMQSYLGVNTIRAAEILSNIPKPREMVTRLLAKARSDKKDDWAMPSKKAQLVGISRMLNATGLNMNALLSPTDSPLK
jgi:hypothetical protein